MHRGLIFVNIIGIFTFIRNAYCENASFYTAGVVEFRPITSGMSSADMLMDHLNGYNEILYSPKAKDADIIVFPEGTLNSVLQTTFVPAAEENIIPCLSPDDLEQFLVNLSCTARDVRKYVVINLTEKENCTAVASDPRPCAPSGLNIYNTNVVFDREGRVISRYRKVHVYVEAKNTTLMPEFAMFHTDFGVTFGHFICFDMLFYTPAQELVDRFGVRNIIFPSMFYSELPFLTAVQLQQSWAWGNNVNLLAAGASHPQAGMTGSGIFMGKHGSLNSLMVTGNGTRKLLVAKVPKEPAEELPEVRPLRTTPTSAKQVSRPQLASDDIRLLKDPQISSFQSELFNFTQASNVTRKLCDGDLCCEISVSTEALESRNADSDFYLYRFGVFDGRRTYEKEEWSDIKLCALYACTNESVESCAERFSHDVVPEASFVFKSLEISGGFDKVKKMLIMPNSLDMELYPLQPEQVEWNVNQSISKNHYQVTFTLTEQRADLLTFGIYAHYYEKSGAYKLSTKLADFSVIVVFCLIVRTIFVAQR